MLPTCRPPPSSFECLAGFPAVNPGFELAASHVVLGQNLDEVVDFVRLCVARGARYVHFYTAIAGDFPPEWRDDRASQRHRDVMGAAIELCARS